MTERFPFSDSPTVEATRTIHPATDLALRQAAGDLFAKLAEIRTNVHTVSGVGHFALARMLTRGVALADLPQTNDIESVVAAGRRHGFDRVAVTWGRARAQRIPVQGPTSAIVVLPTRGLSYSEAQESGA